MTERRLPAPVRATFDKRLLAKTWRGERKFAPGAIMFNKKPVTYMMMICPCGCGRMDDIPVTRGEKIERNWLWDGDEVQPSLSPSIRLLEGEQAAQTHWHGHLRQGRWEQA